jgi:signal transduction histidine kinase
VDPQRLERLIEVGQDLLSELDPEALLKRILEAAREIIDAEYAAVGVLDERREQLERFVTAGIDPDTHAAIGDLPRGRGVLGVLIADPKPLRLTDVGEHPASYGFPTNHPPMNSFLGVPIVIRGEAWGNLYLTEKRTGEFDAEDERAASVLAVWAAIAIDNARLYRDLEGRRDELEQAVRGLEATTEISTALGGEIELPKILELIVKRGRALVCASSMLIEEVRGDEVTVIAAAGEVESDVVGFTVPLAGSVAFEVLATGRPRHLRDVADAHENPVARRLHAAEALYVPLVYRQHRLGVIAAYDRTEGGPGFGPEDERLMQAFAVTAAAALATGQNAAEEGLRRSLDAAEHERTRWARELHDETLQQLGALKLLLASARRADDITTMRGVVDRAVDEVASGISTLRALITDLRPAALDEIGVEAAIEGLVDRTGAAATGLRIVSQIDLDYERGRADTRPEPELEAAIYRLVQEALTNVVKHADAAEVSVSLREDGDVIRIEIEDDGKGFDTAVPSSGFGLLGMRERLALVGGSLSIDSAGGRGTAIRAELPSRRRGAPAPAVPYAPLTVPEVRPS